jgi:NAD(P)H-flavin reductase
MDLLGDLKELSQEPPATPAPQLAAPAEGGVPGLPARTAAASPNIYRPHLMRVAAMQDETPDVRTLRLEFVDPQEAAAFDFRVGQFGLYNALGEGESTFCIASSSTRKGYLECTFRQAGRVTRALRRLNVGDLMGFRGPYGNSFPVESWKGKDLVFIAGGIALPPMRSVIQYCLDHRPDYGDITIIYGAKTWSDHVYKTELAEWEARPDVRLWLCIDWKGGPKGLLEEAAEEGWRPLNLKTPGESALDMKHRRYTGFVPHLVEAVKPAPANRIAVLCGPPIMIKFTLQSLKKIGFQSENVFTTVENRMKCGLGKCGRCNVGPVYVCKEGPVFTAQQVEAFLPEL